MIDRDEMRIARRTVERNGYTVLPPREKDENDLNRFRSRRDVERRSVRSYRDDDDEPTPRFKPLRSREIDDDDDEPVRSRPVERKPLSDLERAKRTAEFNGYTVQKMSRLDQAKQVAQDAGYEVRKAPRQIDDEEEITSRPIRRTATQNGSPMRRPVINREKTNDGIRTRTAPDIEIQKQNTETAPKKPSYEDDYVNRAAAFFGDDD